MERMLFGRDEFERLYSCKNLTSNEWDSYRNPNFWIGMLYLVPGVLYLLLYIPFLVAMVKKQFIKHSCYKLMFLLGILDLLGIILSGILTGILTIQGEIFCLHRHFNYVIGCFSTGIWSAMCFTCIILAINRALDFIYPKLGAMLFEGKRCFAWYFPPVLWGLYFIIFRYPHVYSSRGFAFFFQPYFNISNSKLELDGLSWNHRFHSINNSIVIILLPLIYALLCICFFIKTRSKKSTKILITKMQKIIFIQCFLLCAITVTAAIVYVQMNYLSSPPIFLSILGQMMLQAAHGAAVVIYLLLNKSLRKATFKSLFPKRITATVSPSTRISKKQIPVLKVTVFK